METKYVARSYRGLNSGNHFNPSTPRQDLRLEGHHREKQKVYQILFPLDQNCPRKRRNALINARPCLPTVPMSNVFTMIYLRYHFPIITRAHFIFKEVVSWSERLDPSLFPLLISRTYAIVEFLSMVCSCCTSGETYCKPMYQYQHSKAI